MTLSKRLRQVLSCAISGATALSAIAGLPQAAEAQASKALVNRPPQFVLLAFDGSQSHTMWNATRDFARTMTSQGKPVKFTYFISGVYYTMEKNKRIYQAAGHSVGRSDIGWGSDAADVLTRIDLTSHAYNEGHEIASHANGHFDGSKWTSEEWANEFTSFNHLLFNAYKINGLTPSRAFPNGYPFSEKDVVGFRAPLLGVSPGLWPTLRDFHMRYDTSQVSPSNYWPERHSAGHWNFPLASLRIAGTGKKTLSMDFNFYYADSSGKPDPAHSAQYEEQMYQTYLKYFESNYNGNRAPIHIGHHFSLWNGGAYWRAMQRFAGSVCGMPEVRCVTYRELADFMDQTPSATVAAYRRGDFAKLTPVRLSKVDFRPLDLKMNIGHSAGDASVMARIEGKDTGAARTPEFYINDELVGRGRLDLEKLRAERGIGGSSTVEVRVKNRDFREVLRKRFELSELGTESESLSPTELESRIMKGDMPEAHLDEFMVDAGIPQ